MKISSLASVAHLKVEKGDLKKSTMMILLLSRMTFLSAMMVLPMVKSTPSLSMILHA
jgi:hypothetical protein